jgi:hypothetical protein
MIPEDVFTAIKKNSFIEFDAWDRLETSLREEMQALRRQDLATITQSTTQKEMAMNGVKVAADQRRKYLSGIGLRLGLKPPAVIEKLFSIASQEQRQELSSWQAKFAAGVESANALNRQNMDAIKTSQAVVVDSIRFLKNITEPLPSYTSGGLISAHTLQGRIVSKRG